MVATMESAKLMPKGQVTIPVDIRKKMNVNEGDQIIFIYDNERVIMMNAAVYAMKIMQDVMKDESKKKGYTEKDIVSFVKELR